MSQDLDRNGANLDSQDTPIEKPQDEWNEEEGILTLEEFKPQTPSVVSVGLQLAKNPVKRARLKSVFLDVLRSTGLVTEAAKVCQIPKSLAWSWRYQDVEFASSWDRALASNLVPHLEAEAVRRAMAGSDLLMIFMLKALNRDKYDDKVAEKTVTKPSIMIQIRDVDQSLVAIAEANKPALDIPLGIIDDTKKLNAPINAEYVITSNESTSGTTGASKK